MNRQQLLDRQLARLVRMLGSDPAFYLLSLHSFVEMILNQTLDVQELFFDGEQYSFADKMYLYRRFLLNEWQKKQHARPGPPAARLKGISHLDSLSKAHHLTNRTRHDFAEVSIEEAIAGTWSFLEFCRLSGLDSPRLQEIRDNLAIWEERKAPVDHFNELRKIRFSVHLKDMEIRDLNSRLARLSAAEKQAKALEQAIADKEQSIEALETGSDEQKHIIEALTRERNELKRSLETERGTIRTHAVADQYRENLLRLSNYTRTKRDFERSIVRLSGEQKEVLAKIQADGSVLVRGAAGTGKTIVLLESLRRTASQNDLFAEGSFALLTYANTLVKYDRYISQILGVSPDSLSIETVDRFVSRRLHSANPRSEIRYGDFLENLIDDLGLSPPAELSSAEAAREIDEFIWGYGISRDEYVDQMIPRSGLPHRLDALQRERLWEIQDSLRREAAAQELFTRNLAVLEMLENPVSTDGTSSPYSRLYVDEVQDLPPVVLRFLKSESRSIMMAGDIDQAIYGLQSPFARAGLDIRGRSHMLNENFRNTIPILELAEEYRKRSGLEQRYKGDSPNRKPRAFREGPPVGLYSAESMDELEDLLMERLVLIHDVMGYDPQNVCIICPDNRLVARFADLLRNRGDLRGVSIRDKSFDFTIGGAEGGPVRLSPIHSTKGLDFPVVLLFLPYLSSGSGLDREYRDLQRSNLMYVALTRAMDHLEIFITEGAARNPAISPLVDSWHSQRES